MSEHNDYLHILCTTAVTQDMLETLAMIRLVDADWIKENEILALIGKTRRKDDTLLVTKIIETLPFVARIIPGSYQITDVSYQDVADAAVNSLKPHYNGSQPAVSASWAALAEVFSSGDGTLADYASRLAAWKQLRRAVASASA